MAITSPSLPRKISPTRIEGISQFVQQFVRNELTGNDGTPTLDRTLNIDRGHPSLADAIKRCGPKPTVLFQGYTAPSNARAFRDFLVSYCCDDSIIHALDLHDMPALYRQLEIPVPELTFHVADACDCLKDLSTGQVSILIQHGLANCCPPPRWLAIQEEGSRLLSSDGFALMLFSELDSPTSIIALTPAEFESLTGATWDPHGVDLAALDLPHHQMKQLLGKTVYDSSTETRTLITAPSGRFEFFTPFSRYESSLAAAGLVVRSRLFQTGLDSNGILCRRSHCLVGHR